MFQNVKMFLCIRFRFFLFLASFITCFFFWIDLLWLCLSHTNCILFSIHASSYSFGSCAVSTSRLQLTFETGHTSRLTDFGLFEGLFTKCVDLNTISPLPYRWFATVLSTIPRVYTSILGTSQHDRSDRVDLSFAVRFRRCSLFHTASGDRRSVHFALATPSRMKMKS